ncbi:MAG: hypothetical protein HY776_03590 [Actinobacteria bacterium]|nr:hypothetical protein [Actinomycetota bacterium]
MRKRIFVVLVSMVLIGGSLVGCGKPVEEKKEEKKESVKVKLQPVPLEVSGEVKSHREIDTNLAKLENNIAILLNDDLKAAKKITRKMEDVLEDESAEKGAVKIYLQEAYDIASEGITKDVSQSDIAEVLGAFQKAIGEGKDKDKIKETAIDGFENEIPVEEIKKKIEEQ